MSRTIDVNMLANFSPLDGLKKENRHALANKTEIREAANGDLLFSEGDAKKRAVYVLNGTVDLVERLHDTGFQAAYDALQPTQRPSGSPSQ